jgi:hypothetical protein
MRYDCGRYRQLGSRAAGQRCTHEDENHGTVVGQVLDAALVEGIVDGIDVLVVASSATRCRAGRIWRATATGQLELCIVGLA